MNRELALGISLTVGSIIIISVCIRVVCIFFKKEKKEEYDPINI
jgi:hypothetical protein